jgi:hypothetical protein
LLEWYIGNAIVVKFNADSHVSAFTSFVGFINQIRSLGTPRGFHKMMADLFEAAT